MPAVLREGYQAEGMRRVRWSRVEDSVSRRVNPERERWAMNRTSRIWPVIGMSVLPILCALMQGCIGAGVAWSKTESFQDSDPKALQKALSYRGTETNLPAYTPTWLETNWGKPDSIRHSGKSGTTETWTYGDELSWNGVMLFLIIPIPLEVPVGREWTKMTIQDGRV